MLRETEYWASLDHASEMRAEGVRRVVEQRIYRSALVQEHRRERIRRGILLIRPEGNAVGQVHGLAVVGLADVQFGHPTRITATIGLGNEGVIDIERQADLGGHIHTKGVLTLSRPSFASMLDLHVRSVRPALPTRRHSRHVLRNRA